MHKITLVKIWVDQKLRAAENEENEKQATNNRIEESLEIGDWNAADDELADKIQEKVYVRVEILPGHKVHEGWRKLKKVYFLTYEIGSGRIGTFFISSTLVNFVFS